jgi:hypothetical protein
MMINIMVIIIIIYLLLQAVSKGGDALILVARLQ